MKPKRCQLSSCKKYFELTHPRQAYCSDACRKAYGLTRAMLYKREYRKRGNT